MSEPNGLNTKTIQVQSTLNAISEKLDTVQESVSALEALIAPIVAIRGAIAPFGETLPTGAKTSIAWSMYRLMDAVAPSYPRPAGMPLSVAFLAFLIHFDSVMGIREPTDINIADNLDELVRRFGIPTGDATTTLLGELAAIVNNTACGCGARPPTAPASNGCVSPYSNPPGAVTTSTAYPGRVFATWGDDLPLSIIKDSWLESPITNAEIKLVSDLALAVYVVSSASHYFTTNPISGQLYPTNTWVDMGTDTQFAFSVPDGADIRVYLCLGDVVSWEDCIEIDSQAYTVTGGNLDNVSLQAVPLNGIPNVSTSSTLHASNVNYVYSSSNIVVLNDFEGVHITLLTANYGIRVVMKQSSDGDIVVQGMSNINEVFIVPYGTAELLIDNFVINPASSDGFRVRICPPTGL